MTYTGFCSSLLTGHEELKGEIHALGRQFGGIYVAEKDDPRLSPDPLANADRLLQLIRETPLLFCILGAPHHGTSIGIARTSYFEIELFQAALLQRSIHVFEFEGFSPDVALKDVLTALRPCLRPVQWKTVRSDANVVSAIRVVLDQHERHADSLWTGTSLARLVTNWWHVRAMRSELDRNVTPIRWLNDAVIPGPPPDPTIVTRLLSKATAAANQEQRLGRLWLVLRELMGAPFRNPEYDAFRSDWSSALTAWWSSASWYGLHGHGFLGPLAAGKTLEEIHGLIRSCPNSATDTPSHPARALASSHYSIAKLLLDGAGRRWHFAEALTHIMRGLKEPAGDHSDLLLIRGSIAFRQLRPWTAVDEYSAALSIRQRRDVPPHQIGEALTELGFAYLFTGRILRGRKLLNEGVRLLADGPDKGLLFRAQRKLVAANLVSGRFRSAARLRKSTRDAAKALGYLDQSRQA